MNRASTLFIPRCLSGLLAVVSLALLSGCETPARRLDRSAVQTIQPGVTTRQDILREYGSPHETTSAEGRTLLFYKREYSPTPPSGFRPAQPATVIGLSVLCGPDERVLRTHYSFHHIEYVWGAGTVSAGTVVDEKLAAKIRFGVTTRKEAIALLGEPWLEQLTLSGDLLLNWIYFEGNYIGGRRQRQFRLLFDEKDVVVLTQNDRYHNFH